MSDFKQPFSPWQFVPVVNIYSCFDEGVVGSLLCLIEVEGDSATRNGKNGYVPVFVLFPSTMVKHVEVQSSNRKNHHYP